MNFKNSETSDHYRLLLNLTENINVMINISLYQILQYTIHVEI